MPPELIADYQCQTGEGPLWHPDEKQLYWLDIPPENSSATTPPRVTTNSVLT